ncbi:hypothetical protein RhiirA4_546992 [Rhizophagus irregularis]|uniref:Uncharacterized protein n=1 Tax=Rhizophagus irregularis TaxID=588596 RepID=A0A2I1GZT0_9GLOM|nr:hypothetical protein RhiirA4_546992 [Rhizophagus irregularis]
MHLSTISTNIQLALRSIDDLDKLKELPQEIEVLELVRRKRVITGKDVIGINVEKEKKEIKIEQLSCLINVIWDTHLSTHERNSFDKQANNMMNKFNNEETLCLVARINVPQEMKLPPGIPGEFYKGYTNFGNDDNDDDLNVNLERLIFTSVFSEPSDFQWP